MVSNGVPFARFTGELVQVNRDGSVKFDFKDRDGRSLGKATTLQPAPAQRAVIGRVRHDPRRSLAAELALPAQFAGALIDPRIVWRSSRYVVHANDRFEEVRR